MWSFLDGTTCAVFVAPEIVFFPATALPWSCLLPNCWRPSLYVKIAEESCSGSDQEIHLTPPQSSFFSKPVLRLSVFQVLWRNH